MNELEDGAVPSFSRPSFPPHELESSDLDGLFENSFQTEHRHFMLTGSLEGDLSLAGNPRP